MFVRCQDENPSLENFTIFLVAKQVSLSVQPLEPLQARSGLNFLEWL